MNPTRNSDILLYALLLLLTTTTLAASEAPQAEVGPDGVSRSNLTKELRKTPTGQPCSLLEYPYEHKPHRQNSENLVFRQTICGGEVWPSNPIWYQPSACQIAWQKKLVNTAKVQGWAGEFQEALTAAQELQKVSDRDEVLVSIAEAQARTGEFEEAQTIASCQIHSAYNRAKALIGIAEAQAVAGEFQEARTTAQGIDNAHDRAKAHIIIAEIAEAQKTAESFDFKGAASRARARALLYNIINPK